MKVNDNFPNAEITLKETVALMQQLEEVKKALRSFYEWKEEVPTIKFPVYMRESVQALMNTVIKDFGMQYPNLQTHFKNGDGESSAGSRLSSAILTISSLMAELKEMHYLIRSDELREHLKMLLYRSMQHLLLFIYMQYILDHFPMDEYLPLFTYCEKEECLVEDFVDTIKELQKEYEAYPNIYEIPSEVADEFMSVEYELCTKAEEIRYPLTEEVAAKALLSEENMNALKEDIEKASRDNITFDTQTSHEDVLQRMKLG